MNIFSSLTVGDSASWLDDPILLPDGRTAASSTWVLTYALRGPGSVDITAQPNGNGFKSKLSVVDSATLSPGLYAWGAYITTGSADAAEKISIGLGQITFNRSLADTSAPFEARSLAQMALAQCEAAMATFNRSGGKIKRYDIAGRSMEFQTIADLMNLHSFWKTKVLSEGSAASIAAGGGNHRNLYARFVRPD